MGKIARSFGTHDGSFHADEVTACALLLLFGLIDQDKIIRTRDPMLLAECEYVCDVGSVFDPSQKLFDHHQLSYTGPLSSAGMILEYLYESQVMEIGLYTMLRQSVVAAVDAHDNGKDSVPPGIPTYSIIVASFCPPQQDVPTSLLDQAFFEALSFGQGFLKRLVERYQYIQGCKEEVAIAMERAEGAKDPLFQKVLILDRAIPWIDAFFERGGEHHPAFFVIMPVREQWKLRAIPPLLSKRMQVRKLLPKSWAGHEGESFQQASGIPGAIFCHKGRFIAIFKGKEDAISALEKALAQKENDEDDF